jgi:CxxC motif-containing protein (DUF1111 family)
MGGGIVMRASSTQVGSIAFGLGAFLGLIVPGASARAGSDRPATEVVALGRTLFQRSWKPQDIHCYNGDGLGPVYNETSCVACHNLGGSGGGGSLRRNAEIVTPLPNGTNGKIPPDFLEDLKVQTGLRSVTSSVLHKFGTSPVYQDWRKWLLRKTFPGFSLRVAERNTPALFGAGLIDAIPDAVLEARETQAFSDFPTIKGRVSRLRDGTIGRFGWKGQTSTLDDFVKTACSAELGLEVPGHHQSPDPSNPKDRTSELDLTEDDCRALAAYVASLPAPIMVEPESREARERWFAGGAIFKSIGCSTCHTPTLGNVNGLYSDLLLHDLGPVNSGDGYYSSGDGGTPPPPLLVDGVVKETPRIIGALSPEWRTTPLWGLRDSSPYMHDGKARSIEEAIGRHGGQAQPVQDRYNTLTGEEKMQLRKFLLSLAAPPNAEHFPAIPNPSRPRRAPTEVNAPRTAPPRGSITSGSTGAF